MLLEKAVLIISPEPWSAHFVSKHHYARVLAQSGRTVFFLNPPSAGTNGVRIRDTEYDGLKVVDTARTLPGIRFLPSALRRIIEARWLNRLERTIGRAIGTIWLFENSRFYDLEFAGSRLKIYHQVDLNQKFQQETAARTADICFCTTDLIKKDLQKFNSKVFKIHHGAAVIGRSKCKLRKRETGGEISATYIGNLDMQFLDVRAMVCLVTGYPNVIFNLVGGFSESSPIRVALKEQPNVRWWGKTPFTDLPDILESSDILLVAYKPEHQEDQASPHKFMEYLFSGSVIVCSYTDEYKDKSHLVEMAHKYEPVVDVFERVIKDISVYNSIEQKRARRDFALEHTYEKQLLRISELISQQLNLKM